MPIDQAATLWLMQKCGAEARQCRCGAEIAAHLARISSGADTMMALSAEAF